MDQGISSLIFLALLIGIFYFMLIRPQKRRVTEHRNLIESLETGDEIVTIGGLYGEIKTIGEDDLVVEVAPGTNLRFIKSAIARRVTEDLDEQEEVGTTSEEEGA